MALKVLILRKKLMELQSGLEAMRSAGAAFLTREAELSEDIEKAATEEEKAAVDAAVEQFDADKSANQAAQKRLEEEIASIEQEIKEIEEAAPPAAPVENRKELINMEQRIKFFGMGAEEARSFFARDDVKDFLKRTRELGRQNRTITGAELLIPTVMLELIRENITKYSKLQKYVNLKMVSGKARQPIAGTVPEGIWTEMIGKLNEESIQFNVVEVDGYKVGGFIVVNNSVLEDSDLNLATEIISALGQSIGYALDKAILYGKGVKMPLGIVTRLAQATKPSDYPTDAPEWKDLHITNLLKLDSTLTEAKFYAALITATSAAKSTYSRGSKVWAMNETTAASIMSKSVVANMSGTFVASVNGQLPIIGGTIETLDFIPDGDIIGGYGDLYLLSERAGTSIAQSEHVQFLEDNTVYKATARYDGKPTIGAGFVGININNTAVTTSVSFAADTANTPSSEE